MPSLELLRSLGAWSVEGFWVPLLAWTVLACLVWLLMRAWRSAPPLVSYAALTSVLLALPLGVLLANITQVSLIALWSPTPSSLTLPALPAALAPSLIPEATSPVYTWTFLHSLGIVMVLAGTLTLGALVRLGAHSWSLSRLRRTLQRESPLPEPEQILTKHIAALGLRMPVQLVVTSVEVVPMTFGWRRPIIVLPASLLQDDEALRLTLLHELVHIRRADYLSQWIGYAVGALFAIHPFVWLLRRSIAAYREMACDAAVLDQRSINGKRYAALLYRFALNTSANPQLALSMAAAHRELKNRILAMKSHNTPTRFAPRTVALTLAVLLMGLTTLIVACTDIVGPDPMAATTAEATAAKLNAEDVFVVVEEMPELIGGLEAIQQDLHYPKLAKLAGIEGRVFIEFIVGTDGKVASANVVRGIGSGCDEEALRVVQAASFKPGRQGGEVVPVKMSLPVTFRLKGGKRFAVPKLSIQQNLPLNVQKLTGHQIRDVQVTSNGETLLEGPDYILNSANGTITITNEKYLEADLVLSIRTTNQPTQ